MTLKNREVQITIPDDAWEPNDGLADPRSRLLATISINDCPMHLEAWEVRVNEEGIQEPTAIEDDGDFWNLYAAVGADGHFQTVEIGGREYILVASPYC
ncbi:MAG TPA: hypothetical protein VGJ60_07240 [Chloroflexota bacterium]|jgi:hypothetical protein